MIAPVRLQGMALCLMVIFQVGTGLDNGFSRPPMGWSALYGAPFSQVSEQIVLSAGQGLVEGGLLEAGYEYVNLDDW